MQCCYVNILGSFRALIYDLLLQISPYLGGLGLASGAVAFNVALYYNTIIAWCLKYLIQSFFLPLPWSSCPAEEDTTEDNYRECQVRYPMKK